MSRIVTDKIRVGFVGGGGMTREHLRAFTDLSSVEIIGITNRSTEKAEALAAEFFVPRVFSDIETLYAEGRPDLVCMAVYEPAIHAVAERCLTHDGALFMEKPIGLDLSEARSIATLAKTRNRRVFVGLNRRSLAATRAALQDLSDDPGPRFMHVQDQQSLEVARAIGHDETVVANWMYANSIHLVDYLLTFGRGSVAQVETSAPFDPERPGVVVAQVRFTSGDFGIYEAIWNGPGPWACSVSTPRRRWEMRPLEKAVYQTSGERVLHPVDADPVDAAFKPGFRVQAERVVGALLSGENCAPTIKDALEATELVARIYGKV